MPQISISVSQEVYDGLRKGVLRHQEANAAAVVRKLVTCYAKGIIFFRGAFPDIHRGKLDEFELEIFQGELPETTPQAAVSSTGDASAGKSYVMSEEEIAAFPKTDWDAVEADLKKEKK